jgi:hypothetical protein
VWQQPASEQKGRLERERKGETDCKTEALRGSSVHLNRKMMTWKQDDLKEREKERRIARQKPFTLCAAAAST